LEYYSTHHNYAAAALEEKAKLVSEVLDKIRPSTLWDLGGNTGYFSRIASRKGIDTFSFDADPACVEANYLEARGDNDTNLLPLVQDITNPSPAIGWENQEHMGLLDRQRPDMVLALALIHHLAISNNLPLDRIASYFSKIGRYLLIEFVPKSDVMVQQMLVSRDDIFSNYTREGFETAFGKHFVILDTQKLPESGRLLYLLVNTAYV